MKKHKRYIKIGPIYNYHVQKLKNTHKPYAYVLFKCDVAYASYYIVYRLFQWPLNCDWSEDVSCG